jgi:L-2-hydroxyglutarate oxidase
MKSASGPPSLCDLAVVGGGIVGLAVARELLSRNPRSRVTVFEGEQRIGSHQTGHNSGVIHAGIYYAPGSLKAKLCVEGARELYEYCLERDIAHERCGKLIVATDSSELERLSELERRGVANGVTGIRRIDADELRALEPHASGVAAIHSPATGITDFGAVARSYAADVTASGGTIHTGCAVELVQVRGRRLALHHHSGITEAGNAVFCACLLYHLTLPTNREV